MAFMGIVMCGILYMDVHVGLGSMDMTQGTNTIQYRHGNTTNSKIIGHYTVIIQHVKLIKS